MPMVVRFRGALVTGAACLAGALALGAGLETTTLAQPAHPPGPSAEAMAPAPGAATASGPAEGSLLARADALARQVAALRGLPLRAPIVKEVVDKRELRRRLVEMIGQPKEAAQLVRGEVLSKHWGLVPREVDYHEMLLDVLSEQIAGYYDSDAKKLTLTDDPAEDPSWSEMVLSHEILHALQDQTFSLSKFRETPPDEDDAAMARLALVEGDGVGTMLEVYNKARGLTLPWQSSGSLLQTAEALAEATEPDLEAAPLAVREALAFPYTAGFLFVAELRRQQPWSAVDAAFRRPPVSTEQILHPALYLRNELPLPVPALALPAAVQRQVLSAAATTTPATTTPATPATTTPATPATPAAPPAGPAGRSPSSAAAPAATAPSGRGATTTSPSAAASVTSAPATAPSGRGATTTSPSAARSAAPAPAATAGPLALPTAPDAATARAIEQARRALRGKGQLETVWGELGFTLFLRSHGIDARTAKIAAAGWGGDRVTVLALENADQEIGVARMRWDSEADAREAFEASVKAIDRWLGGARFAASGSRARWTDDDGRVTLVERRAAAMVIARRVPAAVEQLLGDELWRALPASPAAAVPAPVPLTAPPPAKKSRRAR